MSFHSIMESCISRAHWPLTRYIHSNIYIYQRLTTNITRGRVEGRGRDHDTMERGREQSGFSTRCPQSSPTDNATSVLSTGGDTPLRNPDTS